MLDALNAFIYRAEGAAGGDGTLSGMTVGVKANIAVKGMPFHAGLGALENRRADADAQVVAKLRKAGAIITGILNMEEGALGAKTDNPHFGATQNPHQAGYSPGGSSGGSGAAVAAGLCDVALGTDTMGSVRIPSAHCGIYGFKPATDRISQEGLLPADPSLDAIGPMARSLDDLEAVSRVISDFGEGISPLASSSLTGHEVPIEPEVASAFAAVLSQLEVTPTPVQLSHPNSRIRFAGFIGVSKFMAKDLAGVPMSEPLAKLLTYGPKRSADDWAEDRAILAQTREEVRAIIAQHHYLIMPTVPNAPFAHSAREPAAQADLTCLANIAALPAISLPMGWRDDGLPLGIQIVGQSGFEAGLFKFARHIDNILGAYHAPQL